MSDPCLDIAFHGQYLPKSLMPWRRLLAAPSFRVRRLRPLSSSSLLRRAVRTRKQPRREALEAERAKKAKALAPPSARQARMKLLWMRRLAVHDRHLCAVRGLGMCTSAASPKAAGWASGRATRNWFLDEPRPFQYLDRRVGPELLVRHGRGDLSQAGRRAASSLAVTAITATGRANASTGSAPTRHPKRGPVFLREGYEFRGDAIYKPIVPVVKVGGCTAFRHRDALAKGIRRDSRRSKKFHASRGTRPDQQPDYLWSGAFVDVDYRDQPRTRRCGGHFRLSYDLWHDLDDFGFCYRDLRVRGAARLPDLRQETRVHRSA